jgi:predicted nucleic acid-binding Zn ribbon protein
VPTCPICGTEIKEDAGFCPRCWQRLVTGQPAKEKSKKRLVAIILPCVAAIIVAVLLATHLLPLPSGHVAEIEYSAVTAHDLGTELLNPQLTDLQRQDLWKDYGGKRVEWTGELESVSTDWEGLAAHFLNPLDFARTDVLAVFEESQRENLLELSEGDLVTYTGVLADFGQNQIRLTDCTVVAPALVRLWWNDDVDNLNKRLVIGDGVVCLGPSTYDDAVVGTNHVLPRIAAIDKETGRLLWRDESTGSVLVGTDSRYVYTWRPTKIVPMSGADYPWYWYSSDIVALDEVSGQTGWDFHLYGDTRCESQIGCLPDEWSESDFVDCCILQGSVKDKIKAEGGTGPNFLAGKPPLSELTYEDQGVVYRSACAVYGGLGIACGTLQAVDQETGDILWMMTFQDTGMTDFSIVDGVLYVLTASGVGAFEL